MISFHKISKIIIVNIIIIDANGITSNIYIVHRCTGFTSPHLLETMHKTTNQLLQWKDRGN